MDIINCLAAALAKDFTCEAAGRCFVSLKWLLITCGGEVSVRDAITSSENSEEFRLLVGGLGSVEINLVKVWLSLG